MDCRPERSVASDSREQATRHRVLDVDPIMMLLLVSSQSLRLGSRARSGRPAVEGVQRCERKASQARVEGNALSTGRAQLIELNLESQWPNRIVVLSCLFPVVLGELHEGDLASSSTAAMAVPWQRHLDIAAARPQASPGSSNDQGSDSDDAELDSGPPRSFLDTAREVVGHVTQRVVAAAWDGMVRELREHGRKVAEVPDAEKVNPAWVFCSLWF